MRRPPRRPRSFWRQNDRGRSDADVRHRGQPRCRVLHLRLGCDHRVLGRTAYRHWTYWIGPFAEVIAHAEVQGNASWHSVDNPCIVAGGFAYALALSHALDGANPDVAALLVGAMDYFRGLAEPTTRMLRRRSSDAPAVLARKKAAILAELAIATPGEVDALNKEREILEGIEASPRGWTMELELWKHSFPRVEPDKGGDAGMVAVILARVTELLCGGMSVDLDKLVDGIVAQESPDPLADQNAALYRLADHHLTSWAALCMALAVKPRFDFSAYAPIAKHIGEGPAFVGNARSKEVHLATCTWAAQIAPYSRVGFERIGYALVDGHDGCRYCLPHHDRR